jgi:hypothetical protein
MLAILHITGLDHMQIGTRLKAKIRVCFAAMLTGPRINAHSLLLYVVYS